MRARLALTLVGCALATACGGSSTTPTPTPSTNTWSLTGTITSSAGGFINAATVAIVDGPDLGRQSATDATGRYGFTFLHQVGFTIRVSAPGYTSATQGITLIANTVTDVQLVRLPVAALSFEGELGFLLRANGSYDVTGTAVNTGDGCAGAISGSTTLTGSSGTVLTFAWSLPATLSMRPGERAQYAFGPISRSDVIGLGGTGSYVTRFVFVTVACP
jgi:carboxypeptidase family protein